MNLSNFEGGALDFACAEAPVTLVAGAFLFCAAGGGLMFLEGGCLLVGVVGLEARGLFAALEVVKDDGNDLLPAVLALLGGFVTPFVGLGVPLVGGLDTLFEGALFGSGGGCLLVVVGVLGF